MEKNSIAPFPLIVVGGSAGSLEVILSFLPLLRKDLKVAILIVLHRSSDPDPVLQSLLSSKTSIAVKEAEEKELLMKGVIYIAPADYHLLIEKDFTFSLDYSEKVNYSRPSIDVTFEIAAEVFKERTTGILLSGANTDGTEGLMAVKATGGTTVVQDPSTASVPYMPQYAVSHAPVDHVLKAADIAAFINSQ
ncbi:MAG: chemotaxis protein CheB [Chitinophagaceae bacterium]|nr:chemotaxis protein CheB [Chitinophagaceae bacterium]